MQLINQHVYLELITLGTCSNRDSITAPNTHRATTYLCTACNYEEMRGSYYCFKGVTKEHMVCCSNSKRTLGIYVFSSKIHSMMPKRRNTSFLL